MKKTIAILLLGALLTLSFVGCNEQPNSGVTPNNTDNTTTPEVTTPAVTTPNLDVTVPEETTPPLDIDPAPTAPEDNGDTNLPEDEVITFTAKPFISKKTRSPLKNPIEFTINNGDITINIPEYLSNALYEIYYVEKVELTFPDEINWYVEENEQTLSIFEKIKNTKPSYMLQTSQNYSSGFNPAIVYCVDGIYYFVTTDINSPTVKAIYYASERDIQLPLSNKNTVSSYPKVPTTPPKPTGSDPFVVELFGNDLLEFSPTFFAQSTVFSSTGDKNIRIFEGNLYIDGYWYEVSYCENADIKYYDEYSSWGVEQNEENIRILNALKNSTNYYLLTTQAEDAWYREIALIEIDGVYYFLELNDSNRVRRIHYINLNQGE